MLQLSLTLHKNLLYMLHIQEVKAVSGGAVGLRA